MRVVRAGIGPSHRVPSPARPTTEVLIGEDTDGGQLLATLVVIPPGGEIPEHDHGGSAALLVPLTGDLVISGGSHQEKVTPGIVVALDRNERIRLMNRTDEPVVLVAAFAAGSESINVGRPTTGGGGTPEAAGNAHWVPAGPEIRLDDEQAVHADLAGHPVCLVRSRGTVYALLDECSHERVALSEGDVEDGHVECWLHGSRFDLATGVPTGPPATRPVPVYPVRTTTGGIEVALPPEDAAAG